MISNFVLDLMYVPYFKLVAARHLLRNYDLFTSSTLIAQNEAYQDRVLFK